VLDVSTEVAPRVESGEALRPAGQNVTYLLALDSDQAERVIFLAANGQLWMTLAGVNAPVPGPATPGRRTADYLEKVMFRITYVGAAFLCLIAIVPTVISASMNIPIQITAFLGGTGLLIVVSVALDMVQRIEANLLMRNYGGFLGGDGRKGKRIKGRQY